MNKIKLLNINKHIKNDFAEDKYLLKNINFNIESNGIYSIIGHSGSGKSTLAKILSTFDLNFDGAIEYESENEKIIITSNTKNKFIRQVRKNIKILFQETNLQFFKNTIIDEIIFTYNIIERKNKINDKNDYIKKKSINFFDNLNFSNINYNLNPNKLSLGQQRYFLINLIILLEPKILILDEPSVNLDEENKENLIKLIKKISKDTIVIILSHDEDLINISKKIILLYEGEIVFDDSSVKILSDSNILKKYKMRV